jgi:hypothetical protein
MKNKRIKDAHDYQESLKHQIQQENHKSLKIKTGSLRNLDKIKEIQANDRIKSKNSTTPTNSHVPEIGSSRYSISNTACTRDLFTPSEDN